MNPSLMYPLFSSMSSTNKVLNNNSIKTASTVVNWIINCGFPTWRVSKKLKEPYIQSCKIHFFGELQVKHKSTGCVQSISESQFQVFHISIIHDFLEFGLLNCHREVFIIFSFSFKMNQIYNVNSIGNIGVL